MSIIEDHRPYGSPEDSSGVDQQMLAEVERLSEFRELGVTGLKRASGYLDEEFLPQLRGRKAVQVYKEMSENEPLVGALLFSIDRLLRNQEWRVEPAGKSRDRWQRSPLRRGLHGGYGAHLG